MQAAVLTALWIFLDDVSFSHLHADGACILFDTLNS